MYEIIQRIGGPPQKTTFMKIFILANSFNLLNHFTCMNNPLEIAYDLDVLSHNLMSIIIKPTYGAFTPTVTETEIDAIGFHRNHSNV